jgi:hypothetical protein
LNWNNKTLSVQYLDFVHCFSFKIVIDGKVLKIERRIADGQEHIEPSDGLNCRLLHFSFSLSTFLIRVMV